MTKACKTCQIEKPLDDFHKARTCKDGHRPICRECVATAMKARRDANIERERERDRKRYAENPKRRAQQRATAKEFYWSNAERQRELRAAYYRANPERWTRYRAERQARLEAAESEPYTRRLIYDRGEGHCAICGVDVPYKPGGFHIDHIVPLCRGGADTLANIQLTCPPCNWSKWTST